MSDTRRLRVAIAGAGGMGREALAWLRDARPDVDPVAFFAVDPTERPTGADVGLPVIVSLEGLERHAVRHVVLGVGSNQRRLAIDREVSAAGLELLNVVHPSTHVGPGVRLDEGTILGPGVILTRDITVGRGCILNYGARIGHDCRIEDFAFVGPGATVSGDVRIAPHAFVGAGAVLLPGVSVGISAVIGAGAVVTRDVPDAQTVVGVPAREVRQ